MSLDVGDALRDGANRTTAPNGLALMVGFVAVAFGSLVARDSYLSWAIDEGLVTAEMLELMGPNPAPLAVGMPVVGALGLWIGTALVAEGLRIVSIRTFFSDHTDRIPAALATRRIGRAVANGVVGTFLVDVVIVLGGLFLLVPGVFLALAFFFVRQEIAVEDANFVDAMAGSWERTEGHRVELAVLGIVWIALWLLVFLLSVGTGAVLASEPVAVAVVSVVLGAPLTVFGVAVGTRAYAQLREEDGRTAEADDAGGEGRDGERARDDTDTQDDDDEEWPDPPGLEI